MTLLRWLLLPALLALALALQGGVEPSGQAFAEESSHYVPGELLVGVRSGVQPLHAAGPVPGARAVERLDGFDVLRVDLPADVDVRQAIDAYEGASWVEYAEPNYYLHAALTPNDPLYAGYQSWYYDLINAPSAWSETTGDSGLIVGVIDSGLDLDHPDLNDKIVPGEVFISNPTSGCTSPPTENDDNGHGTMVGGIVGAESNNGQGVAGTDWSVKLMGVKALDCNGSGTTGDIADGIEFAVDNGADVINMSLGQCLRTGPNCDGACAAPSPSFTLQTAIDYAEANGVTMIAASGNDDCPYVSYPAAFPEVIAVGASGNQSNPNGRAACPSSCFSNWGPEIDVAAPGSDICSTAIGGYACGGGTSFATPIVSGLAALILSQNAGYDPEGVRAVLCSTAVNLPDGSEANWDGCGRVDMAAAVSLAGSDYDSDALGDEWDEVDDLKVGHWALDYVIALHDAGITGGCLDAPPLWLYCPLGKATRAEIAKMLVDAIDESFDPDTWVYQGYFSDVLPGHWATPYIEYLYEPLHLTTGCKTNPLRFCPSAYVTRAEVAAFILRALGHADPPHLPEYQGYFTDVGPGLWYTAFVEHLYEHAITGGCSVSPPKYCPSAYVTRAELAAFIVRAWGLPLPP